MFIKHLLKNNISNKLYAFGFVFAVIGYSLWQQIEDVLSFTEENEGSVHFLCLSLSFACYTSAYMFTKWDKWHYFPLFVSLICVSRVGNEIYLIVNPTANPEAYNIFDYINFLLTIWVVFNYYVRHRLKQYNKKIGKNEQ